MIVVRQVSSLGAMKVPCVIALGRFDGVHVGHQAVLQQLVRWARGSAAAAVVLSVAPRDEPTLGCLRQRAEQLAVIGVDVLCHARQSALHPTGLIAALPRHLGIRTVVAGDQDRSVLQRSVEKHGASIETVPMVAVDGVVVSSAAARSAVASGDLACAERMLGRAYAVGGHVVHGLRRGRQLGFPTANLRVRGLQLPPNGVYAVRFRVDSSIYGGVANLGFNPTFANAERSLETHVFGLDADLYGRYVEVTFVAFLRAERKFPGIEALIEQIRIDSAAARRLLS